MKLIFIRHAVAKGHHLEDEQADFMRKLTKEGKKAFKQRANKLQLECEHIDVIFSSALLRSIKTASILYKNFNSADLEFLSELDLLNEPEHLVEFIKNLPRNKTYAFIGHEPHLNQAIFGLTSKKYQLLKKGHYAIIEFIP
jgi:phosphohistidine phosphatase SixA